jgi:hypothetical protein
VVILHPPELNIGECEFVRLGALALMCARWIVCFPATLAVLRALPSLAFGSLSTRPFSLSTSCVATGVCVDEMWSGRAMFHPFEPDVDGLCHALADCLC